MFIKTFEYVKNQALKFAPLERENMDKNKSKKDSETMIEQFNAGVSKFFLLKKMFGYCGIRGCKEKKQGKPDRDSKFKTVYEKNTAVYLSGFCASHSDMIKEKIDAITDEIEEMKDSDEELIEI